MINKRHVLDIITEPVKKNVTHQSLMLTCQVGFNDNTRGVAHSDYKVRTQRAVGVLFDRPTDLNKSPTKTMCETWWTGISRSLNKCVTLLRKLFCYSVFILTLFPAYSQKYGGLTTHSKALRWLPLSPREREIVLNLSAALLWCLLRLWLSRLWSEICHSKESGIAAVIRTCQEQHVPIRLRRCQGDGEIQICSLLNCVNAALAALYLQLLCITPSLAYIVMH